MCLKRDSTAIYRQLAWVTGDRLFIYIDIDINM